MKAARLRVMRFGFSFVLMLCGNALAQTAPTAPISHHQVAGGLAIDIGTLAYYRARFVEFLIHSDNQQSHVVLELAATKIGHLEEHAAVQLRCGPRSVGFDQCGEVIFAELLPIRPCRLRDPVRVKEQPVPRIQSDRRFRISRPGRRRALHHPQEAAG